ncbi:MAG: PIN domain-containing protein [Pseudomonadota bacterium]
MTPIRAIFDTNVFVGAGFNPQSASVRLLNAVSYGNFIQVWSTETRAETQRILDKIPPLDWEPFAKLFTAEGRYDGALDLATASFVTDPEDRKFAALSISTGAPIISSDHDLLCHTERLNVCKPGAFWQGFIEQIS